MDLCMCMHMRGEWMIDGPVHAHACDACLAAPSPLCLSFARPPPVRPQSAPPVRPQSTPSPPSASPPITLCLPSHPPQPSPLTTEAEQGGDTRPSHLTPPLRTPLPLRPPPGVYTPHAHSICNDTYRSISLHIGGISLVHFTVRPPSHDMCDMPPIWSDMHRYGAIWSDIPLTLSRRCRG